MDYYHTKMTNRAKLNSERQIDSTVTQFPRQMRPSWIIATKLVYNKVIENMISLRWQNNVILSSPDHLRAI